MWSVCFFWRWILLVDDDVVEEVVVGGRSWVDEVFDGVVVFDDCVD